MHTRLTDQQSVSTKSMWVCVHEGTLLLYNTPMAAQVAVHMQRPVQMQQAVPLNDFEKPENVWIRNVNPAPQ